MEKGLKWAESGEQMERSGIPMTKAIGRAKSEEQRAYKRSPDTTGETVQVAIEPVPTASLLQAGNLGIGRA